MESKVRAPQAADTVIVLAKMKSGRFTEFSGYIEEVSADHAYFALDSIHLIDDIQLIDGSEDDERPIESKIWPKTATNLLRVGVPLDELKPFDGAKFDESDPCWEVTI
jgi:hypothetical protein